MKKKILTAFIIACTLIMSIGIINASAGTYGDLTYTMSNGEVTITDCKTSAISVIIPSTIENCPVTSIGEDAFSYCSSLTSIEIPDSVSSIGDDAFYSCESLTSITIPNSVTSIGNFAFEYCSSLTSITIPDSVSSIGIYVFTACRNLTSIEIPDSVTNIGSHAFYGCSSLTSIEIPDSVTSIGGGAFSYCSRLISIEIPDSVTSIGDDAFYNCRSLTSITMGNGVTSIGYDAFYNCSSLTSITIPDSVTNIGSYAFYNCSSLTSIEIPDSVTSIGDDAFYNCSSLTSITIGNSVTSIGNYTFYNCRSLTSITIGNSVTSIGYEAFYSCDSLATVYYNGSANMWNSIYIEVRNDSLINAIKIYKMLDIVVDGYEEKSSVAINGKNYKIEPITNGKLKFDGYYTEKNGKGTKLTDAEGNSLNPFSFTERITVYPYFLDQALIEGPSAVMLGDCDVKYTVSLYTNKEDVGNAILYIKYPNTFTLKGIPSTKTFDEVSLERITKQGDFFVVEIIGIYSYDGDAIPDKTNVEAFDLYFDVLENSELKDITIEITPDSKLMNESDYSFSDFVNQTVKINPKLVESIEISGPTTIYKPSQYTATILPDYATNKTVKWSVNDETIATISEDGILTPIKTGDVTVIATALDGSGIHDELEVEVIVYAQIDSITTDGSWSEEFENGKTEYVIYVGEDRASFNISATYSKGTLKINNSTLLSGRTITVSLTQERTPITIKRTNVTDNTDITYTLTVIKTAESFIADIEKTDKGYSFDITLNEDEIDSFETATVMVALYDDSDNQMLLDLVRVPVIKGTPTLTATVETNKTPQYAKIMLWGGTNLFNPLCVAKEIPVLAN